MEQIRKKLKDDAEGGRLEPKPNSVTITKWAEKSVKHAFYQLRLTGSTSCLLNAGVDPALVQQIAQSVFNNKKKN